MILSTLFYVLGVLCLGDILPAVFALTKFGDSWGISRAIAWIWILGSVISALISFAIATMIERQRNIEKTVERIEDQLHNSDFKQNTEWQKNIEDTLHRIDSNLFWESKQSKQ